MMLPVPIRLSQRALRGVLPTLLAIGIAGLASYPAVVSAEGPITRGEPLVVAQSDSARLQSLLDEARQHLEAERASQALEQLERAYDIDPNNVTVIRLRSEALAMAEQQAADDPASRVATLNRAAQSYMDSQEFERAVASYREALSIQSNNRDARRGLERAERELSRANAQRAQALADAAAASMADGNYEQARAQVAEALELDPSSRAARRVAEDINRAATTGADTQTETAPAEPRPVLVPRTGSGELSPASALDRQGRAERREAEAIFRDGLAIYEDKDKSIAKLEQARQLWTEALTIDPGFERARVYLENTAQEFAELVAEEQRAQSFEAREAAAQAKMRTLIPIQTAEPTPLRDILNLIKPLSGIDFVIAGGVRARVEASFTDRPLNEVLDAILIPNGLQWERRPGTDVVIIRPDLRTRIFPLTRETLSKVEGLLEDGTLQSLMYGAAGEPNVDGQRLFTDRRQDALVITDSQANIDKLESLLRGLRERDTVDLVFASYTIQEEKGPQIKALLEAILRRDDTAPFNPDRKLILEGRELIVRDTPANIREVERILSDRQFLARIYDEQLDVGTFNLTPILDIQDNPDLARRFGADVRQVVETLLYSQEGITAAAAEGRRLWYDEATLQLTITDTPDRLQRVANFIQSLPQIQRERRSKIRALNWANAADLVAEIRSFLGIDTGPFGGAGRGNEVIRTVRRGQEFEFQGAFFRIVRVEENDPQDPDSAEVTVLVRSAVQSDEVTILIYRAEEVLNGEFTIVAEDIRPTGGPGEGRARLRIVYNPLRADTGLQTLQIQQQLIQQQQRAPTFDISIEPIINLNSVWIQYSDAAELAEVEFWIDRLDVPTLQVSMEVKFVEVIENKARQLKADFNITDLTDGFDFSDSVARGRFAQDIDEYQGGFEPFTEGIFGANLLKGATVTSWIINNGNSPISFTLRALEAQGIINIVNAPSLTVLNGETGTFSIWRTLALPGTSGGLFGRGVLEDQDDVDDDQDDQQDDQDDQDTGTGDDGGQDVSRSPFRGPARQRFGTAGGNLRLVDNLEITPIVTQAGNITLSPVSVLIQDFENHAGAFDVLFNPAVAQRSATNLPQQRAVFNTGGFTILEKDIITHARIRDGGTVVLGGWKNERSERLNSQTPVLGDIPYVGKLLFSRMQETQDRVTLLIFLTGSVVRD